MWEQGEIQEEEIEIEGAEEKEGMGSRRSSRTVSVNGEESVYIGVGKGDSSLDALSWALSHFVNPSTTIFLVHVFPETHSIPYPLGRIPRDQASREQVESYMAEERGKRRALLQKFLNLCSASKVRVETILVESDSIAKAIQDLIPILNIRKLVLGITKSNARKLRSRRGNNVTEQIMRSSAIYTCEVKVICEGNEMSIDDMTRSPSSHGVSGDSKSPIEQQQQSNMRTKQDQSIVPFACICFIRKPKTNG